MVPRLEPLEPRHLLSAILPAYVNNEFTFGEATLLATASASFDPEIGYVVGYHKTTFHFHAVLEVLSDEQVMPRLPVLADWHKWVSDFPPTCIDRTDSGNRIHHGHCG